MGVICRCRARRQVRRTGGSRLAAMKALISHPVHRGAKSVAGGGGDSGNAYQA